MYVQCKYNVQFTLYCMYNVCTRAGTKVVKQHSKLCQQKKNEYSKDLERKPPKLDYCFITSTSLIPVTVSTWIWHRWTEK